MKKFSFSLESVLKVRGLHRQIAERDLAATRTKLNRIDEEITRVRQALQHSYATPESAAAHPNFHAGVIGRYREVLKKREEHLQEQRKQLQETLEVQKKTLTKRMKDEMVMENLKDHQRQDYMRMVDAAEQAEIEEIDLLKRGGAR